MQTSKVSQEFFIEPGVDIQKGDAEFKTLAGLKDKELQERWNTSRGQNIIRTWRAHGFDRGVLDGLVGRFFGQTDLRGAPLANEDMSRADLSKVDFFAANLENTRLNHTDLTGSFFSEANLKGARFDWAKTDNIYVDNAQFDKFTSFTGVKLNTVDFNLAEQLRDHAFTVQRIAGLKRRYPKVAFVLWLLCDYGRSFPRFFAWCGGVILAFAAAYTLIPGAVNQSGFWNALYFSVMTFASAGCDVQAVSAIAKVLAAIQTGIGFLMTGLLIAILTKRTIGD